MSNRDRLYDAVHRLWAEYQQNGPGGIRVGLWNDVDHAWNALRKDSAAYGNDVQDSARKVVELCRRCALRPEGLCFVTGEAGLVPRRELHAEFGRCLKHLAEVQDRTADEDLR